MEPHAMPDAYEALLAAVREIGQVASLEALLDWDLETNMPPGGLNVRAEQLAFVASLAHQRRSDPKLGELLSRIDEATADPIRLANLREIRRFHERAVKIPTDLVRRIARTTTIAKAVWTKARAESKFALFAPHLTELLELKGQMADALGWQEERYDALLDEYEPGMTTAQVSRLFGELRGPLSDLVRQLAAAKRKPDSSILHRQYPREAQERFARRLAEAIGFDFDAGRMDVSTHPFCTSMGPGDVRFTTRYAEEFFNPAAFGVLHEAGHGLYEQGLDPAHLFTPMGQAVSLGVHESQSRLWENFVGRSREFWEHFFAGCQKTFPLALDDVALDAFYAAINAVCPSPIRVEADEVTYNLHIILRFDLERELLSGKLAVPDVPAAWNEKLKELLGITPRNDAEGCLQDIHWSMGAFGYFPTYTLGNIYAAQIQAAARQAIPDLADRIRRGDFSALLGWLRTNIHRLGQQYRSADLIRKVTGGPPSIGPFLEYVRGKYGPIYGL
jgi:carboxypeptidase Taq